MRITSILFILATWILAVTPDVHARGSNNVYSTVAIDELRLEVSDLKHDLHSARVEINLLDEKVNKYERTISFLKEQLAQSQTPTTSSHADALERKVAHLEKLLEKTTADLRSLNTVANQALNKLQDLEQTVAIQDKKCDEVAKLKGTLTSISKAISQTPKPTPLSTSNKTYRVKPGDSLEKIARAQQTTVSSIKQLNQLTNDKIVVGQELKLSDE